MAAPYVDQLLVDVRSSEFVGQLMASRIAPALDDMR